MNTYKITFERENGTTGSDNFTAATEAQARKEFKEVYRHGNGQITSIELISENAPATKEQERKALEKIRKIVEELGEGSYVGIAFEGCFEIAEENIENDFGCSMKQRAESAEKKADDLQRAANTLATEREEAKETIKKLEKELEAANKTRPTLDDIYTCIALARAAASESRQKAERYAEAIVELADTPDCPEFRDAVVKNRAYNREVAGAEQLTRNLEQCIG